MHSRCVGAGEKRQVDVPLFCWGSLKSLLHVLLRKREGLCTQSIAITSPPCTIFAINSKVGRLKFHQIQLETYILIATIAGQTTACRVVFMAQL